MTEFIPKCPFCGSFNKVKLEEIGDPKISFFPNYYEYNVFYCTACEKNFNAKMHYKITPIDYEYDLD